MIYDMETFLLDLSGPRIAADHSRGQNDGEVVTLTINEALPSMKRLTEAIQEHWKAMIHEAIDEAARQKPLPYFEKAMVEITIITPHGTNNANVWDTSNRAINGIIKNLKGIFFRMTTWNIWLFPWLDNGVRRGLRYFVFQNLTNQRKSETDNTLYPSTLINRKDSPIAFSYGPV